MAPKMKKNNAGSLSENMIKIIIKNSTQITIKQKVDVIALNEYDGVKVMGIAREMNVNKGQI